GSRPFASMPFASRGTRLCTHGQPRRGAAAAAPAALAGERGTSGPAPIVGLRSLVPGPPRVMKNSRREVFLYFLGFGSGVARPPWPGFLLLKRGHAMPPPPSAEKAPRGPCADGLRQTAPPLSAVPQVAQMPSTTTRGHVGSGQRLRRLLGGRVGLGMAWEAARGELLDGGLCVVRGLLGDDGRAAAALRHASLSLFAAGGMRPGALGGGGSGGGGQAVDKAWRGDYVAWLGDDGPLDPPPSGRGRRDSAVAAAALCAGSPLLGGRRGFWPPSREEWSALLSKLTAGMDAAVSRLHGPGLVRGDVMASVYPPGRGAGFRRHVDNPEGDGRRLSAVYYVNGAWAAADGALLRGWPGGREPPREVLPEADVLVVFRADTVEHEVTRNRIRGQQLRHLPPRLPLRVHLLVLRPGGGAGAPRGCVRGQAAAPPGSARAQPASATGGQLPGLHGRPLGTEERGPRSAGKRALEPGVLSRASCASRV
ncbi:unnamed protein product, partial [Prorocentrum cordatum]